MSVGASGSLGAEWLRALGLRGSDPAVRERPPQWPVCAQHSSLQGDGGGPEE